MQTTVVQIDRRAWTLCGGGGGRERTEEREEAEEGASGAEDLQDQDRARILYKPGSVGGGRKQRGRVLSPPPPKRGEGGWVRPDPWAQQTWKTAWTGLTEGHGRRRAMRQPPPDDRASRTARPSVPLPSLVLRLLGGGHTRIRGYDTVVVGKHQRWGRAEASESARVGLGRPCRPTPEPHQLDPGRSELAQVGLGHRCCLACLGSRNPQHLLPSFLGTIHWVGLSDWVVVEHHGSGCGSGNSLGWALVGSGRAVRSGGVAWSSGLRWRWYSAVVW